MVKALVLYTSDCRFKSDHAYGKNGKKNKMSDYKHICSFNYCKTHQECLYKNASAVLKNHPCKAKVGVEANANIIVCYEKGLDTSVYVSPYFDGEKYNQVHCENPKCSSVADLKFNGELHLCYKCVDLLREHRTNYELGTIFRKKVKLLKLLKVIDELINEPAKIMVRCSNIYCGTLDNMTKHHLIPKPFRNKQTVPKIPLCEDCHKKVHQLATNQELAENYNTKQGVIELLATDVGFRVATMMRMSSYATESLMSA